MRDFLKQDWKEIHIKKTLFLLIRLKNIKGCEFNSLGLLNVFTIQVNFKGKHQVNIIQVNSRIRSPHEKTNHPFNTPSKLLNLRPRQNSIPNPLMQQ